MCNELKRERIRIFRHDGLMTRRVLISSHGGQRIDAQGYNPGGFSFYMDRHFGAPTSGTLSNWITRYQNNDLAKAGGTDGAVGDYMLTKFQGYHHAQPYRGRKIWHFLKIHRAAESYQDIRNFVDNSNHVPVDVVTIRNVEANRNGMALSDVIAELQQVTTRYNEVIMAFCLVQPGYGGYLDMFTGQPFA
jgi:hypothetical protein